MILESWLVSNLCPYLHDSFAAISLLAILVANIMRELSADAVVCRAAAGVPLAHEPKTVRPF
jgi:hypothetical protein